MKSDRSIVFEQIPSNKQGDESHGSGAAVDNMSLSLFSATSVVVGAIVVVGAFVVVIGIVVVRGAVSEFDKKSFTV